LTVGDEEVDLALAAEIADSAAKPVFENRIAIHEIRGKPSNS